MTSFNFQQHFQSQLPGDPETQNTTRQVQGACFSYVRPKQVSAPQLVAYSKDLASELGLSEQYCQSEEFLGAMSGNLVLEGMNPYAMCYGGHQFGNWAGQLGDGRAINLGDVFDRHNKRQMIQLKGAGPTPYSRHADGLAVLRSSVREFLCSEAMFHLGIPTTRALSLVLSGDGVERDMFYSGNPEIEPGAIVSRVAPSFLRFGNYEIFSARGDVATLDKLVAYTIANDFPELSAEYQKDKKSAVIQMLQTISHRTCEMIVHWMRVGFVHGVMNTDNMSVLGLTIDYGPYGWLDNFDPTWTPNTTDKEHRRYRYGNQPAIAQWNLLQLANALYPLVESVPELECIVRNFRDEYDAMWHEMMMKKLGLYDTLQRVDVPSDFFHSLEQLMAQSEMDMTLFYRRLLDLSKMFSESNQDVESVAGVVDTTGNPRTEEMFAQFKEQLTAVSYLPEFEEGVFVEWICWFKEYRAFIASSKSLFSDRQCLMNNTNPAFTLRNFVTQEAIDNAHQKDFSTIATLQEAIANPYVDHSTHQQFSKKRPEWAMNKAGCSMLSCSS
ncbi:MAG: YdiU family protein [Agarilytica sp.]